MILLKGVREIMQGIFGVQVIILFLTYSQSLYLNNSKLTPKLLKVEYFLGSNYDVNTLRLSINLALMLF
jgi:hypothetical protein